MQGETWQLVFDASGPADWGVLDVLPFVVAAAAPFALRLVHRSSSGRTRALLLVGTFIATLSLLGLSLILRQIDQERAEAAVDGRCRVFEGAVSILVEEPYRGHGPHERIQIGQAVMEFSYFSNGRFYHQTLARGGALKQGTKARVCLLRGQMVRVEVAR